MRVWESDEPLLIYKNSSARNGNNTNVGGNGWCRIPNSCNASGVGLGWNIAEIETGSMLTPIPLSGKSRGSGPANDKTGDAYAAVDVRTLVEIEDAE